MKFIYPAVFHKTKEGTIEGYFPDLKDCRAEGDSLDDAIEKANEAAAGWIELELSEEMPQLPPVSDAEDLPLSEGDVVRNICVNIRMFEGWDE